MRFFMDGRYIRSDYHDGISRFSYSLIHVVAEHVNPTVIISDPLQREMLPTNSSVVELHAPTSVLEPLAARKLNVFEPDVVFSPMQTIGSMGRKFGLILTRSEEHTSELQSRGHLVCRLLLEKKKYT